MAKNRLTDEITTDVSVDISNENLEFLREIHREISYKTDGKLRDEIVNETLDHLRGIRETAKAAGMFSKVRA